ncbi:hypothetical protein like AT5G37010 [Hibiscus trionum]|uniref:Uncharacterized protein n=1 Tax=Hibiscus trionum TaxID=183268 RepID=A0A9W7GW30_HIBTR|nr:hypothetical protein like AT5G37010 [Hibiscus trionum]
MGVCFSKKKASSSHLNPQPPLPPQPLPKSVTLSSAVTPLAAATTLEVEAEPKIHKVTEEEQVVKASQEESLVKKEVFIIKHRKSHDKDKRSHPPPQNPPQSKENEHASSASTEGGVCNINTSAVRTSSCTKEEVDAILIQCGRLSRSNSSGKTPSSRKYSGSKRSYDFDCENDNDIGAATPTDDRPRRRPSSRSSSQGRRRTPSRERDQQQRSGSRERSSSGRRVSRSPGRRSENTEGTHGTNAANGTNRPGKMVSVPPTVSSLAMDKSINGVEAATATANGVKRISVKRNVGESPARTAASPRSQSPAKTNNGKGFNENQQQPALSRSSSRKAEHSPYRRNPLSEIDPNSLAYPQSAANKGQGGIKKPTVKGGSIAATNVNGTAKVEDMERQAPPKAGADNLKPQSLTRSRSSRRSRELDLNPETLLNPIPSSYTSLLLEDIQNFHQNNNNPPHFSLPPCVSKACSIVEAVADLNSTTSSNLSDRKGLPTDNSNKNGYNNSAMGRKMREAGDPFVESEVIGSDHLMEPSFHKYVTVRRGGGSSGADMEEQESSGSNSIVASGQPHWGLSASSSWEPNSADSTDRWTKGRHAMT